MNDIKSKLDAYKGKYQEGEITEILAILVEVLQETNEHLSNISNKLWE